MTREEAIEILNASDYLWIRPNKKEVEALNMAIEALQADTVEVVRCKDCAHWSDVELHVCEDGCYGICIIEESTTEANNWCKKGVYKWK